MVRLISLGSSFAAGPGLQPLTSIPAKRSGVNYPSLLAPLISAKEHIDLTYSGATLLNILDTPQDEAPPQIEAIPTFTDNEKCIVTITAGGNDLGYVGALMRESFGASWLGWPIAIMMSRGITPPVLDEQGLVNRFVQVIKAVRGKVPNAEIVLVGYLTLVGDHAVPGGDGVPLTSEQIGKARETAGILRRAYERAAEEGKCVFVDVAKQSQDHGVGSKEPWVAGHVWRTLWGGEMGWHPNKRGMEAVAKMIHDKLVGEGLV